MSWLTLRRTPAATLLTCSMLGLMLASPSGAGAHAFLIRSDPVAGARLSTAPGELRLYFSEPIVGGSQRLAMRVVGGAPVALPAPVDRGAVVFQRLPGRARKVYLVDWRVLADDGHITAGEYAFAVGSGARLPALTTSVSQSTPWGQVVAGWLLFGGLAVALGGLASELGVWRRVVGAHEARAPAGVGLAVGALGG